MGCLRAEPIEPIERDGRFVIERRAASIGTAVFRSQCKRRCLLVFGASLGLFLATPARAAFAASAAGSSVSPAPASAFGSSSAPLPPPPAPSGSPEPALPTPPPPNGRLPAGAQPLPPAPPPRSPPIPPSAAASAKQAPVRPGAPGTDQPAPPPTAPGLHSHDGFYLRVGLGLGLGGALVSSDAKSIGDYSFGGGGGALDVWVGGTPSPGFAMGAALSALALNSAKRQVDGHSISGDVNGSTGLLGYFVDVFPDPGAGLHFGGALGLAGGNAEVKGSGKKFGGGGLGVEAFGGYDFWVSPDWSLGGLARFMGSVTRDKQDSVNYEASVGAFTLSFTALYH